MRTLKVAVLALALAFGLAVSTSAQNTNLSKSGGFYNAMAYSTWQARIFSGPVAAASPATLTMTYATVTLPDGRTVVPFSVGEIVNVGTGATQEAVTLTAVNNCYVGAPQGTCTISGNTSNAHGQGEVVTSGSAGILEAFYDAANNGGGSVYWEVDCGPVTLNTGGVTTTVSNCKVPQYFTNFGGSALVKTTITVATSFSLGIASATGAFISGCTSLTAGLNCSQFQVTPTKVATGTGLGAILITAAGGTPGAGVVRVKAWGWTAVQSNN